MKIVKTFGFGVFVSLFYLIFLGVSYGADVHTCEWTVDNKFCVEDSDISFAKYGGCRSGYLDSYKTADQVEGCKIGTCVPSGAGQCLSRKFKVACVHEQKGLFDERPLEQVEECKIGCCNVKNTFCNLEQKKVCVQDRANGDASAFDASITDKISCDNSCRGADLGCFKATDGTCKYGIREKLGTDGVFYANTPCSEVVGCFVESRKYKSCGNGLENDDDKNVYYYDSARNREELAQACSYPDEKCFDPDKVGGQDAKCVTTKCVESCPDCTPQELRHGESVCLNVPGGQFLNEKRSTGLNNYIFRCEFGEIVPDTRDEQREKRCDAQYGGDDRLHANWIVNDYKKCIDCGEGGSITDFATFVPIIGPPVATGALFGIGESCANLGFPSGFSTKCDEFGDCKYDKDFIWLPFGSCNPKFPPARSKQGDTDVCKTQCGGGGDGISNICSKEECNSIGDCQFEAKTITSESALATGGLIIGTCATALAISEGLCSTPLIGAGCPGFLAGAKTICTKPGETKLYQSLIAMVYSFGAGAASGEGASLDAGAILKDGRVPMGLAIVLSKAALSNLSAEKKISGEAATAFSTSIASGGADEIGTGLGSFVLSTSTLIPYASNYLYKELLKTTVKITYQGPFIGPLLEGQTRPIVTITETPGGTVFVEKLNFILSRSHYVILPLQIARSFDSGTCKKEEAYTDNSKCSLCGPGEGQWFCTKARCDILGGANGHCRYVPIDGVSSGACLPVDVDDTSVPYITRIDANFLDVNGNIKLQKTTQGKSMKVPEKLPWEVSTLNLKIETSKRADCRYARVTNTSYDDSLSFDDEGFPTVHDTQINFSETDKVSGVRIYFKCQDINSNTISRADDQNYLTLEFDKRPDTFPPVIQKIDPQNTFLPDTVKSITLSMVVFDENDVLECKYSKTTSNYDEMENTFDRRDKIVCQDTNKPDCREFAREIDLKDLDETSISLPGFEKNVSSFKLAIKCKDTNGNVMYDEQNWSLFVVPTFGITINSPKDGEETYNRILTINVTTSVSTRCNYTLDTKEYFLSDFETEHIKEHPIILGEGEHTLKVTCRDLASNRQDSIAHFRVLVDTRPPELTRIFKENDKICITLDEAGVECRYENKDIFSFDYPKWVEGIPMIEARRPNSACAVLDEDKVYYIMCKDTWDNNRTLAVYP